MLVHTGAKQNSFAFKESWSYWNTAGSGKSFIVFLSFLLTVCISRNQFTSGVTVIVKLVQNVNNASWREIPNSPPCHAGKHPLSHHCKCRLVYCCSRLAQSEMTYFWWLVVVHDSLLYYSVQTQPLLVTTWENTGYPHMTWYYKHCEKGNHQSDNGKIWQCVQRVCCCALLWWYPDSLPDHLIRLGNTWNNEPLFVIFGYHMFKLMSSSTDNLCCRNSFHCVVAFWKL